MSSSFHHLRHHYEFIGSFIWNQCYLIFKAIRGDLPPSFVGDLFSIDSNEKFNEEKIV